MLLRLILTTPLVRFSGSLIALTSLSSFCSYRVVLSVLDLHFLPQSLQPALPRCSLSAPGLRSAPLPFALSADLVLLVQIQAPGLVARLVQTLAQVLRSPELTVGCQLRVLLSDRKS